MLQTVPVSDIGSYLFVANKFADAITYASRTYARL